MQATQEKPRILELQAKNERRQMLIGKFEEMVIQPRGNLWPERPQMEEESLIWDTEKALIKLTLKTIPILKFSKKETETEIKIQGESKALQKTAVYIDRTIVARSYDQATEDDRRKRLELKKSIIELEPYLDANVQNLLKYFTVPLSSRNLESLSNDPKVVLTSIGISNNTESYQTASDLPTDVLIQLIVNKFSEEVLKVQPKTTEYGSRQVDILNQIYDIKCIKHSAIPDSKDIKSNEIRDILLVHFGMKPENYPLVYINELLGIYSRTLKHSLKNEAAKGRPINIKPEDQKIIERLFFGENDAIPTIYRKFGGRVSQYSIDKFVKRKIKERLEGIDQEKTDEINLYGDNKELLISLLDPETYSRNLIWIGLDPENRSLLKIQFLAFKAANYRNKNGHEFSEAELLINAARQVAVELENENRPEFKQK